MSTDYEVIIRLDEATRQAYICSCWPVYTRKLTKKYGDSHTQTHTAQDEDIVTSSSWTLPIKAISFRSLTRLDSRDSHVSRGTRQLSEAHKAALQAGRKARQASLSQKHHK